MMKAFIEGFASTAFNGRIQADMEAERLSADMLQAFYRREHATVEHLAKQGAKFNAEMLHAAVGFQDRALVDKCLEAGVAPTDDMIYLVIDKRNAALTDALLRKTTVSDALRDYALRNGTDDVRRVFAQKNASVFMPETREL